VENILRWAKGAQAAAFPPALRVARHAHHLIVLPAVIKKSLTTHTAEKIKL
jgi:hypothetical protein